MNFYRDLNCRTDLVAKLLVLVIFVVVDQLHQKLKYLHYQVHLILQQLQDHVQSVDPTEIKQI
jgi:hypothetical protein